MTDLQPQPQPRKTLDRKVWGKLIGNRFDTNCDHSSINILYLPHLITPMMLQPNTWVDVELNIPRSRTLQELNIPRSRTLQELNIPRSRTLQELNTPRSRT